MTETAHTAELATAEQAIRALADRTDWWVASQITAEALRALLAEYDRRGEVEQVAASYVMGGLCGSYDSVMPDRDRNHSEALQELIAAVRTNPGFRG